MSSVLVREARRAEGRGPFSSHTLYGLAVYHSGGVHVVYRRYSALARFCATLRQRWPRKRCLAAFPPKRPFPMRRSLVASRCRALNVFLARCSGDIDVVLHPAWSALLGLPQAPGAAGSAAASGGVVAAPRMRSDSDESLSSPNRSATGEGDTDHDLFCPITTELMVDAVACVPCGHSFSEVSLRSWLRRSRECPSCRGEIREIRPNHTLRDAVLRAQPFAAPGGGAVAADGAALPLSQRRGEGEPWQHRSRPRPRSARGGPCVVM